MMYIIKSLFLYYTIYTMSRFSGWRSHSLTESHMISESGRVFLIFLSSRSSAPCRSPSVSVASPSSKHLAYADHLSFHFLLPVAMPSGPSSNDSSPASPRVEPTSTSAEVSVLDISSTEPIHGLFSTVVGPVSTSLSFPVVSFSQHSQQFTMKDLGDLHYFLGIQVVW